ncbi:MAG TPA: peptidylprolyl isomerase [Patescibacteria group bacterium]|nr:peptidylprolyl isomerase [Patescibacteria group bacterium]
MLWLALLLGCEACGSSVAPPPDAGADVIAHVGDRSIRRDEFSAFLAATLGGPAEVDAADAEVKSRLLDQYLDDELLVSAAMAAGLKVSDDEIRAFQPPAGPATAGAGSQGSAGVPGSAGANDVSIRRILLTRKFKQQVILGDVKVAEEEIRAYFNQHLDEYRQPATVVLRQILLDNAGDARNIRAELMKDAEKFEEIASTRSLAPDGGKPYPLEEALLPDTLRKVVVRLQPGELSEVVQDPQGFFILKLEDRQPEKPPNIDEARQRIALKLLQDRGQKKYDEFVAGLRAKVSVSFERDKLGFPYMKREKS